VFLFPGNAFLVNVALADLLVTGLVMPVSMIVILAGHEESLSTCRFESTLEILCFLVTILTLTTIAGENYARLCMSAERYVKMGDKKRERERGADRGGTRKRGVSAI